MFLIKIKNNNSICQTVEDALASEKNRATERKGGEVHPLPSPPLIRSRAADRCGIPIRSPDPPASAPIRASFHRSSSSPSHRSRRALDAPWSGDPSQPRLIGSFLLIAGMLREL